MKTLIKNFLGYGVVKNNDGIVITKDGCNPMPGACVFSGLDRAKRSIIRLFMIEHSKEFDGAIYWRMEGSGGAYHEWFTFKNLVEKLGMEIPNGVMPTGSLNFLIGYKGKTI